MPVSSNTSRSAPSSKVSPSSILPLGKEQSPGTNRRMIPPAARMRSLGASCGTINSPLKRYTSLTVDDSNAELWYYDVEFAKISLWLGYCNAARHHSFGVASRDLSSCGNRGGYRERDRRWRHLRHVSHPLGNRRPSVDGERHHDGRRRAELSRRHSWFPISTSWSSRSPALPRAVVRTGNRGGLRTPLARIAASLRAGRAVADR